MAVRPVPLVSVVLPVRNAAATLARAVGSICGQTFADWELLLIDDGSTDESVALAAELARSDPRLRLLRRPREGLVAALNEGLAAARGEFVARMDADDHCTPDRLAAQVAFLAAPAHGDIGLVGSLVTFGGDRAAQEGYARHVDWINALVTPEAIALNRFVEAPLAHPSVMFRRGLVEQHGGYREGDFPEDYELWLRWLDAGVRMAKVPRPLLTWEDPPARLSRTDARYEPEKFFRVKAGWIARELGRVAGGRKILVWGAGRHTRQRAAYLAAHGVAIAGYIDVDRKKTGRGLGGTGVPVFADDALPSPAEHFVLSYVTSRGAREYNQAKLGARGYAEGRDFLLCG